ncbi:MAG TPA: glycosyltransferase family 4 protein [Terriglobales bacterium]|nr:glycosyltransferase family 4 protein [Terriglobales bacterium]
MKVEKPKRIAIIRGANLNKFEMQTYEPLKVHFEIESFCIAKNNFDLRQINLSIHKLLGIEVFLPGIFKRYYDIVFGLLLEMYQPMFGLSRKLKNFDILHIPEVSYYYSYQAGNAKKKYGLKMVATQAENIPFPYGKTLFSRWRINKVIKKVDLFLPLTQKAKEVLLLLGVPAEKIKVIPFGIDVNFFTPQPKDLALSSRFGLQKDDFVILFVGRLSRGKGIYDLVYAAKKLLEDKELESKKIKFLLVGSGREKKRIKRLIAQLNIVSGVTIIDSLGYEFMPKIHNLADIFVLPSIPTKFNQEQFGMVLVESMACEKAVVASQSGSIPEVVGEAGILVQPNDHLSLYLTLKRLVLDHKLREELGKKGRERVMKLYDSQVVSEQIRSVYLSLFQPDA